MTQAIVRFADEILGFPLYPRQAGVIDDVYRDGISDAVLRLGRRSGKGRMAAVGATYEATVNADAHLRYAPPGERLAVVVLASSQRQARTVRGYIAGFLRRPALAPLVARETAEEIELSNGMVIVTLPAHAAAVRSYAIPVLIADEVAWWAGRDGSPLDAKEVIDAIRPAMAQFPARRAIYMSTPRWSTGYFRELVERGERGDPGWRSWHAPTWAMNPSIPQAFLDGERAADPVAFAREYEAEFVDGIGAALDAETVRAAAVRDDMLPPVPGVRYVIAVDPAFVGDTFSCVIGHRAADDRVIVDRVTGWRGTKHEPLAIDPTLDAIRDLAGEYGGARVLCDQFAAQPIRQGLALRGVRIEERPWTNESKVDALAAVRRVLYSERLELPRHRELVSELVSLEQRPTASGRPRIGAPGRAHDDYATALMALVADLAGETGPAAGRTIDRPPTTHRLGVGGPRPAGLGYWGRRQTPADRMAAARNAAQAAIGDLDGRG